MAALRERLTWPAEGGRIQDGARRYLMMRPDVLMGALLRADPSVRAAMLDAFADAVAEHGADSLRAYAQAVGHDASALIRSTSEAAADLGWGRWQIHYSAGLLALDVLDSPFVAGWRLAGAARPEEPLAARPAGAQADRPEGALALSPVHVCAPIRGMFTALARQLGAADAQVRETRCAATLAMAGPADACRFEAQLPMC